MATVSIQTGATSVTHTTRVKATYVDDTNQNLPQGLNSLKLTVYQNPAYRMLNGWPMGVPGHDIAASTLVDAVGQVLENRPDPSSISTMANVRWIADETWYDETELVWRPFQSNMDLTWTTSSDYAPTLLDAYNYSVGSEVFYAKTMNFDADAYQHMWLGPNSMQNTGYTMIMVMSPSSLYGTIDNPYKGIWCFGDPTPALADGTTFSETPHGGWVALTQAGNNLWLQTDQSKNTLAGSIGDKVNSVTPMYLALVVNRPTCQIYTSTGPASLKSVGVSAGTSGVTLDNNIVLGRTPGDVLHCMDMAVMDIGFYADTLTRSQVLAEIATLSQVYGGS